MTESNPTLIYLDTNVYARPLDDQTQLAIQAEANAFLEIIAAVKAGDLMLLSSGVLAFEVAQILNQEKREKIEEYLRWCGQHIAQSTEVLDLGKLIERQCSIRSRDALHVAAAMLGGARYFLSCDRLITEMKQARCYRRLTPPARQTYFSAMNPRLFAQKLKKGEIE